MPPLLAQTLAGRLRALAHPVRIALVDQLLDGEASVQELTDRLQTTQQNVSKHLADLHRAGIVERERAGRQVRYRLPGRDPLEVLAAAAPMLLRGHRPWAGAGPVTRADPASALRLYSSTSGRNPP